ncbi:hypothetical protein VMCG_10485 [Cytospora schulzeri]|uniref:RNase III domain-containing protein n=1 Tax=Cytospora schulzeri TaxID=448051 RepID=A0A423VBQ3_9PEZI|nr:hypothetical protein VMCG_10485 [Valsa malicola]
MTIPLRGWARPRSAAARLAACEQLIGHNFNNLDLLKQALDSRDSLSRRLAIVGDCAVETHLVHRWWKKKDLSGTQWNELRTSVLCNENLSNVGFRMGINKCTLPDPCDTDMKTRMATTIEAVLAAVWLDTNRDAAALERVIDRLGLTHTLLDAGTTRAWLYSAITSSHRLPRYFFSGHHISLIQALSELKQPMIPPRDLASGNARPAAGQASPKQKAEQKRSEAPKTVPTGSRNEIEQLYMNIENDAMSQLSRQVLPSEQPGSKHLSDGVKHPKSNLSVERGKDGALQASVPRAQGAEYLASSGTDAKKSDQDAKQNMHDEGPLFRAKGPKSKESVRLDPPGNMKSDPSKTKGLRVQEMGPKPHEETGTGGTTSSEKGSRKVVTVNQGQKPPEGDPKSSGAQDDEAAREQEIQVLEKRIRRMSEKQSTNPNPSRLEELNKAVVQLDALKGIMVQAVQVNTSTDAAKRSVENSPMAKTEKAVSK